MIGKPIVRSRGRAGHGHAVALLAAIGCAVFFFLLDYQGHALWRFRGGGSLSMLAAALATVAAAYSALLLVLSWRMQERPGGLNELGMVAGVLRFVALAAALAAVLYVSGALPGSWAALAGFAGLLMGWSLQAPVSGVAAWLLICATRPFRVGDRVKLQAWDLRGDITRIGKMYTELNQVGGTVGSEDLAGRTILVPNAMLFQNIVVNYTPHQTAAFVLDEVIVRMTYNSDWATAESILLQAANEVTGDIIQKTGVQPYIRAEMYDYGVQLFLRYMTPAMDRPRIVYELTKRIVPAFARSPDVDFALPYVFSQRTGMQMTTQRRATGSPLFATTNIPIDRISGGTAAGGSSDVDELAESISRYGLLQPVVVREESPGNYVIVAGKLRLAACRQLGWTEIPCILTDAEIPAESAQETDQERAMAARRDEPGRDGTAAGG